MKRYKKSAVVKNFFKKNLAIIIHIYIYIYFCYIFLFLPQDSEAED